MVDRPQEDCGPSPDEEVLRHEREIRERLKSDLQRHIDAWFDRLGMHEEGDIILLGQVRDAETGEQHAYLIRLLAILRSHGTQMAVMPLTPDLSRATDHYFHPVPWIVDEVASLPDIARVVTATNPENPGTEDVPFERYVDIKTAWEQETGST